MVNLYKANVPNTMYDTEQDHYQPHLLYSQYNLVTMLQYAIKIIELQMDQPTQHRATILKKD